MITSQMVALVYGEVSLLIDLWALIATGNNIDNRKAKCGRDLANLIFRRIPTKTEKKQHGLILKKITYFLPLKQLFPLINIIPRPAAFYKPFIIDHNRPVNSPLVPFHKSVIDKLPLELI